VLERFNLTGEWHGRLEEQAVKMPMRCGIHSPTEQEQQGEGAGLVLGGFRSPGAAPVPCVRGLIDPGWYAA
jgi:hypothetical protein